MVFVRICAQQSRGETHLGRDGSDMTYLALPLPAGHARAGDAASFLAGLVLVGALLPSPALLRRRLRCCAVGRARRRSGGFHGRAAFEAFLGSSEVQHKNTRHTNTRSHRHTDTTVGSPMAGETRDAIAFELRTRGTCARSARNINQRTGECCSAVALSVVVAQAQLQSTWLPTLPYLAS
jgi:hypothetical protein